MFRSFFSKSKIFINYRRQDSSGHAGRMYDDLAEAFGEANVIKDIEKIEAGEKYAEVIDHEIKTSNFLLVVIGPNWVDISENGMRRIDNPEDLVGKEIIIAFNNKIPVIPVLVNGARMPKKESLIDGLKELADINAIELSDSRWKYDMDRLIKRLARISQPKRNIKPLLITAGAILFITAITYIIIHNNQKDPLAIDADIMTDTSKNTVDKVDNSPHSPAPIDIVGAGFTANGFIQYMPVLKFRKWKPQFVVLHQTALPTFAQWHNVSGTSRLNAFANFLGIQNGWTRGPHLFIADDSIWVFNDLEKPGIHSPSWNNNSWGVEMVGDFSTEPVNPNIEENAVQAVAALFKQLKIMPNDSTIRFHSDDPRAHGKICPGKNLSKAIFIKKVALLLH